MKRTKKLYAKNENGKRIKNPDVRPLLQRENGKMDTRRGMVCRPTKGKDGVQAVVPL